MNDALIYIDQYFNGELTGDEKKLFENRCLTDPGFAKEVANYILMRDQAKADWVQQKKQDFAELEEEETKDAGRVVPIKKQRGAVWKMNNWRTLAVAATLVGIILLGSIFYLQLAKKDTSDPIVEKKDDVIKGTDSTDTAQNKNIDTAINKSGEVLLVRERDKTLHEQLVAQNFKVDGPPENTEGVLADAFNDYKNGEYATASREYEEAITMIEELDTRSADDEKQEEEKKLLLFYAHYYNSLSHFARGNTTKAIAGLKAIKDSPDRFWQNKVRWYLALAYLKAGKAEDARTLLKQVADSRHSGAYKQKSRNLLNEIK